MAGPEKLVYQDGKVIVVRHERESKLTGQENMSVNLRITVQGVIVLTGKLMMGQLIMF